MRTIKFRGKSLKNKKWVYGDLMRNICATRIVRYYETDTESEQRADWGYIEVDDSTVGQFTGLTDSNGKEIYEGDIFTVNGKYPRVVLWDKMSWALMPTEYFHDEMFWVMNLQHPRQSRND